MRVSSTSEAYDAVTIICASNLIISNKYIELLVTVQYRTTTSILPPCPSRSSPRYKQGAKRYTIRSISQNADELRLEDLPEVRSHLITKLNRVE